MQSYLVPIITVIAIIFGPYHKNDCNHKWSTPILEVQKVSAAWLHESHEELSRILNVVDSMKKRLKQMAEKNIIRLKKESSLQKEPRKRNKKRDPMREGLGSGRSEDPWFRQCQNPHQELRESYSDTTCTLKRARLYIDQSY